MKLPDKDTLALWYNLIALALVIAFILRVAAGINFFLCTAITVPVFVGGGLFLWHRMVKGIEKDTARRTTVLQVRSVQDIGELRQLKGHWEAEVPVDDGEGHMVEVSVRIESDASWPSKRQLDLIREFRRRYGALKPTLQERIRGFVGDVEGTKMNAMVDCAAVFLHVMPDGDEVDVEVEYTANDNSDMGYYVSIRNWEIVDVYGVD